MLILIFLSLESNKVKLTFLFINLYISKAPVSVKNFLDYAREGFYDGIIFHRLLDDFVIQGGGYDSSLKLKSTRPPIKNESLHKLSNEQSEHLEKHKGVDLAIVIGDIRFRINIYSASNGFNVVMRKIETKIPVFHEMGFPPVIESKLVTPLNGLILVTGPTGSGKSTSLAAMIDYINTNKDCNIITVEDPIEFVHEPKNSIITQRELGSNTPSFTDALRESLREDPDVILVGELRDQETISLALTAAETGHLVFGTLHTSGAPNTIHRIIDAFPPGQQDQIRAQIATSLKMVITQRLSLIHI